MHQGCARLSDECSRLDRLNTRTEIQTQMQADTWTQTHTEAEKLHHKHTRVETEEQ